MTRPVNATQKQNSRNVIEIDLKELAIVLISQWFYLLVSGLLAALAAFAIRFFSFL